MTKRGSRREDRGEEEIRPLIWSTRRSKGRGVSRRNQKIRMRWLRTGILFVRQRYKENKIGKKQKRKGVHYKESE